MRYGFSALLHNKGRTAAVTVIVIISVAMVSGINIATASLTSYQVQKNMGDVIIDMRVSSDADNVAGIASTLASVKANYPVIQRVIPITFQDYQYDSRLVLNGTGPISWDVINASHFNETFFESRSTIAGVSFADMSDPRLNGIINVTVGAFPTQEHDIMLDEETALRNNFTIGTNLSIGSFFSSFVYVMGSYVSVNYTREINNLTITGFFDVLRYDALGDLLAIPYSNPYYEGTYTYSSSAAYNQNQTIIWGRFDAARGMNVQLTPAIPDSGFYQTEIPAFCHGILLDHGAINILDLENSKQQLREISNVLYSRGGISYDFTIDDNLLEEITDQEAYLNGIRVVLLLLAIPPIFIGLYLSITISDQTLERRMQEIGQLKSKGAKNRQIAAWFVAESALVGVVGGIAGYFAGFGTCFVFLATQLQQEFPTFMSMNLVHSDWFSLLFSLILGVGVCIIAVVDPIRRLNKIPIVDVTKKQLNYTAHAPWKSRFDVTALITGAFPIIWMIISTNIPVHSLPYMLQPIFLLLNQVMTGVSLLASFFLLYGLIKLVAGRSPSRFSRIASGIARLIGSQHSVLIGRNVGSRPRQSGGLTFIIALTMSMCIMLPVVKASEDAFEQQLARSMIGSDVKLYVSSEVSRNESIALMNDLAAFSPDIAGITSMTSFPQAFTHGSPSYMRVLGINATSFPDVVRFDSNYITTGGIDEAFNALEATPNGTLLLEPWARDNGYHVGDPIIITFPGLNSTLASFVVKGYFSILPGAIPWGDSGMAAVNFAYLESKNITRSSYYYEELLVRMVDDPGVNDSTLAQALKDHFPNEILYTATYSDMLEGLQGSSIVSGISIVSITRLFDIEFAFILVIATSGVAIIIYRTASDRRREIATLRARGMRFRDLLKIQAGEGITLVILGLILGCIGILIGYTINLQIANAFYAFITIARPFVVPPAMFLQLGITFLVLVAVVLFVNWREIKRTDIPAISTALRSY